MLDQITMMPVTEEYRFFCLRSQVVSWGFYWSSFVDELSEMGIRPRPSIAVFDMVAKVLERVSYMAPFVVIDIGVMPNGEAILVELNDAQMSGPSEVNLDDLYGNLSKLLRPVIS